MKNILLTTFFVYLIAIVYSNNSASENPTNHKAKEWIQNQELKITENKGQILDQNGVVNTAVLYMFNSNELKVQLRKNGFSYECYKLTPQKSDRNLLLKAPRFNEIYQFESYSVAVHRIDIELEGANIAPEIIAACPLADYSNYYTSGTPEKGIVNVHHYKKVTYKNIYPHIDLEFVINPDNEKITSGIKYNFIIHPGGNISDIRMKYTGADGLSLDNKTNLKISTSLGSLYENIPYSYQPFSYEAALNNVNVFYEKEGNTIKFSADDYDKNRDLIIDPMPDLSWGTYYGETNGDNAYGVAIDNNGDVVATGYTSSVTNIATSGAFQTILAGSNDGFMVKFDANGVRQWATYYGGTDSDVMASVAIDPSGNIAVSGWTSSTTGIATAGAHQTVYGGGVMDGFVAAFNAGGVLQWGTYYGGTGDEDAACDVAVDASGNIYATGWTESLTGIATAGSHQPAIGGGMDDFIVKFNSAGVRQWGTYYGGSGGEISWWGAAVDPSGNVFIGGGTQSSNNISTVGAYQAAISGGYDGFIAKFNPLGVRQWGTYFGGTGNDISSGLSSDGNGNIILSGQTNSSTGGVATVGSHQPAFGGGGYDGYLVKFDGTGAIQWGTYYGGTADEGISNVCTDLNNNIFIIGYVASANNIATTCSCTGITQTVFAGGQWDTYLSRFTPAGVREWGTYYGGAARDAGYALAADPAGCIIAVGETQSSSDITTTGAHQTTYGGSTDAFIAKFCNYCTQLPITVNINVTPTSAVICAGDSVTFVANGADTYEWSPSTGLNSTTDSIVIANPTSDVTYTVIGSVSGCTDTAEVIVSVTSPQVSITVFPNISTTILQQAYGGTGDDFPHGGQQTSDGGYIIVGHTTSFGSGGPFDAYLLKLDASGSIQWTKTYGESGMDDAYAVMQTSDGGYILSGATASFGGGYKGYLIKTDPLGSVVWSKTYGGGTSTFFYTARQTSDGGYIVTGWVEGFGAGGGDIYVVKTDASGNQTWAKTFGGTSDENSFWIEEVSSGGYIISGNTESFGAGGTDIYVVRIDALGNLIWANTYGGSGTDHAGYSKSVEEVSGGGFAIAGWTNSFGAGSYDLYLIKVDNSGNILWTKTYGGTSSDNCLAMQQTSDGGFMLGGTTGSYGLSSSNLYLLKTDASGNFVWHQTYGGSGNESAAYAQQTSDGGYYISGLTSSFGVGGFDAFFAKTDNLGICGCNEITPSAPTVGSGGSVVPGCITGTGGINANPATIETSPITTPTLLCSVTGNLSFCPGDTVTLVASGSAGSYIWSTGETTDSIIVIVTTTATYSVTVTDSSGCSNTAEAVIPVNGATASITGANILCDGQTATLIASGGVTYDWNTGSTNDSILISPTSDSTYIVTVTNTFGCTDTAHFAVSVNEAPAAVISGGGVISCPGDSVTLTISLTGNAPWSFTYSDGINSATINGVTTSPYVFKTTIEGTYKIIALNDINCPGTSSDSVVVDDQIPTATITDDTVCIDASTTIPIILTGTSPWTLTYSDGTNSTTINGITTSPYIITTGIPGIYSVVSVSDINCTGISTGSVTIFSSPDVAFSSDINTGCVPVCVNFEDSSIVNGGSISTWQWDFGDGGISSIENPEHCYETPGQYNVSLTVISNGNCTTTVVQNNMINVHPVPVANFSCPPSGSLIDPSIQFTDSSTNAASWLWDFGDIYNTSDNTSTLQNPSHTYTQADEYCITLTVKSTGDCYDTTENCLIIDEGFTFYVPNAFSPNGDGVNDVFYSKGKDIVEFEISIYDRWGVRFFYSDDITKYWDGKVNNGNELAQQDVYVYVINLKVDTGESRKYIGSVTLIR